MIVEDKKIAKSAVPDVRGMGARDAMYVLENKLDMTIYAQREHFKVTLRDNLQKLKLALNEANIIPMNVKLLDMKEESETQEQKPTNVYQNNYNNDFVSSSKIDIKA